MARQLILKDAQRVIGDMTEIEKFDHAFRAGSLSLFQPLCFEALVRGIVIKSCPMISSPENPFFAAES